MLMECYKGGDSLPDFRTGSFQVLDLRGCNGEVVVEASEATCAILMMHHVLQPKHQHPTKLIDQCNFSYSS